MRQLLRTDRPRGPTEAHVAVRPKAAGDACSLFAAENTRNVRDLAGAVAVPPTCPVSSCPLGCSETQPA